MKTHKFSLSIIILFTLAFAVAPAQAQFGDLIKKAKKKVDTNTQMVNSEPNGNTNVGSGNAGGGNTGGAAVGRGAKLGEPGSIGLSKSPIDPKNWQAAKYETAFTANDNMYAIIFFGQPITKLGTNDSNEEMIVWFDNGSGVMTDYWDIPIKPEQKNVTVITLPINPAPADVFTQADATAAQRYLEFLKKYDNAKGTIKMLAGGDKQASTIITLDFTASAAVADARAGQIGKAVIANSDKANADNPLPRAGMHNPALERQFAAIINGANHDWKMLKLIVESPEWQISRHEISGAILSRFVVTRNVVKDPTGACRILTVVLSQDYNGGGYGKTYMDMRTGRTDDYAVSCDKAR